jgi:hypothetical protein
LPRAIRENVQPDLKKWLFRDLLVVIDWLETHIVLAVGANQNPATGAQKNPATWKESFSSFQGVVLWPG